MGKALYRKYRSKSLSEIIGQPHITQTLQNALDNDALSHAYLFTGPRGVGKTSIARILAHAVNNLPYADESTHLDIIEIDAASNNGVEHVRELREKAYISPTSARYKVYIIDEVHMLSKPAFNALLKILEEPPAHVIFILATTETHKIPDTIVSRTQRFIFKPVAKSAVVAHLQDIAKQEDKIIDDDALELIAEHGGGSFRDSISMLDQISGTSNISIDDVRTMLGIAPVTLLDDIITAVASHDMQTVVSLCESLAQQGIQASSAAIQLSQRLRAGWVSGVSPLDHDRTTRLLHDLLLVPTSHDPTIALELALCRDITSTSQMSNQSSVVPPTKPLPPKKQTEKAPEVPSQPIINDVVAPVAVTEEELPENIKPAETSAVQVADLRPLDTEIWNDVLAVIKSHHNTLYGVVRMAVPVISDETVTLQFKFAFHQKKINDAKPKQLIAQAIQDLTGQKVAVQCIVVADVAPQEPQPVAPRPASPGLETVSNIFGGAEVLES